MLPSPHARNESSVMPAAREGSAADDSAADEPAFGNAAYVAGEPPWQSGPQGVTEVVEQWLGEGRVRPCLALNEHFPSRSATHSAVPAALHRPLREALAKRGIQQLYSHQSAAIDAALAGHHVVVATPTSSGKSLCFHLPVLQAIASDPGATALYLYPTKALSRDQEHSLQSLITDAELDVGAIVFDGDTRADARKAARERARIVLTNPDMLHAGILPNHTKWSSLFRGLRYVVLDELHTYRGVFGSHMAHVLARLQRIARFHGTEPQFICATATIGNPQEHASRLIGATEDEVTLVDQSGAPASARQFFIYNPPVVDPTLQLRGSALKHAVSLASDLIAARVPTIVFAQSRNSVEIILKYLRQRCASVADPESIMAYRGGYLPETRRGIERGLREGEILCVVATNALELGIDIGDLDAAICVGYPGSIASMWQRFGRAGRRGSQSIALLVCGSEALDQFLAREPSYVLQAGAEEARVDPNNIEVLIQHLKCATFEAPFLLSDPGLQPAHPAKAAGENYGPLDAEATREALEYLKQQGLVHARAGRYYWSGEAYPATHVSLRNIGWDNFVIVDLATDKTLAELDWRSAHTMLHEQAIYQHDAEQYQVERLDYDNHKAFVRRVVPDYFTTALTYRDVEVLEEFSRSPVGSVRPQAELGFGEVKVVEKVTGYKKIKFFTHENAGYGDVHLPEMQMHTTSFWLTLPESVVAEFGEPRAMVVAGLRAAGRALETVATLALMCDPRDLNRTLGDGYEEEPPDLAHAPTPPAAVDAPRSPLPGRNASMRGQNAPTLFLFDAHAGGVGLSERIFRQAPVLLRRARQLIETCPCAHGCPGCIGPSDAGLRKAYALRVLARCL